MTCSTAQLKNQNEYFRESCKNPNEWWWFCTKHGQVLKGLPVNVKQTMHLLQTSQLPKHHGYNQTQMAKLTFQGHLNTTKRALYHWWLKKTTNAYFPQVVWFFRVFMKCLQNIWLKFLNGRVKQNPFYLVKNSSVHSEPFQCNVCLNDNKLLLPLLSVFCDLVAHYQMEIMAHYLHSLSGFGGLKKGEYIFIFVGAVVSTHC